MSMMITDENFIDPIVGIPVIAGQIMTTVDGKFLMVNQPTGEAPGGYNTLPGTDPFVPASIGGGTLAPIDMVTLPGGAMATLSGDDMAELSDSPSSGNPGLPRGFLEVPSTGILTVNGRIIPG